MTTPPIRRKPADLAAASKAHRHAIRAGKSTAEARREAGQAAQHHDRTIINLVRARRGFPPLEGSR